MTRHQRLLKSRLAMLTLGVAVTFSRGLLASEKKDDRFPALGTVRGVVKSLLVDRHDRKPLDIISQGDVKPIFAKLEQLGWKVSDQKGINERILDDNSPLVSALRADKGQAFMRKVSSDAKVYDRLDRVVREKGGIALIRDVIKLPDGHKYATSRRTPGTPDLSDLLLISKRGSGHKRRLKDFDKPTGMIYTAANFLRRLEASHAKDLEKQRSKS